MEKRNSSTKFRTQCLFMLIPCLTLGISVVQAGTPYFSDDFENGMVNWDSAWQITDLFCRSAGHCASDSPTGNYPLNANAIMTLKIAKRVDLSKSTDPVLKFWHRIGVSNGDYGYVEISDDFGFTWKVLRLYTNTWRATWSFEQIDLSAYKASPKPLLFRFRLRDDGGLTHGSWGDPTVTWGWDIDDVTICERDEETLSFPFFDDFESGLNNWMLQAGDAWQLTDKFYRDPNHCISESPTGNYPMCACSGLILVHPIDLSSTCFPVLTFWHKIGVSNADHATIDVSLDGGTTWSPKPLKDYTNVWLANWTLEQVDLSAYTSTPILIRFALRDDGGLTHGSWGDPTVTWGWDIDDLEIRELIYPCSDLIVQVTNVDTSNRPEIRATVTVADANGLAVTGLRDSSFSVYEDDKARTPITVEPNTPIVHVSLALDYSGSMGALDGKVIMDMEQAARRFVDLMNPKDWAEVIKFGNTVSNVTKAKGLTNAKSDLTKAIDDRSAIPDRSATRLFDAVYQAISNTAEQPRSRAVVVMTDGIENRSEVARSATEVINHALAKGVPVFTIGLGDEVDEPVLTTIAVQTGGMYYSAPDSDDLMGIYRKIAGVLKNQYIVTYESAACQPDSTGSQEHELEILVVDGAASGQGAKRFVCPSAGKPVTDKE